MIRQPESFRHITIAPNPRSWGSRPASPVYHSALQLSFSVVTQAPRRKVAVSYKSQNHTYRIRNLWFQVPVKSAGKKVLVLISRRSCWGVSILSQKHLRCLKSSAIAHQSGLIHNTHGTTTVEYALVLMMIAIGATLALNTFTLTTGGTLNILASSVPNDDNPRNAAAEQIGSNLQPDTISPGPLSSAADARQIAAGRKHLLLQILVLSSTLFAIAWAWIILRRQRRRRRHAEETDESVEQIPLSQLQKSLEKRQQILRLLTNDVSREWH